jgi:hypothetical protein
MRRGILIAAIMILIPVCTFAASPKVVEKWLIHNEEEMLKWNAAGLEQVEITSEGIFFDLEEKAAFFRSPPEGFKEDIDAMHAYITIPELLAGENIEEVALLVLSLKDDGEIAHRLRIGFTIEQGSTDIYVPLAHYRKDMGSADVIAISFKGNAKNIKFEGIKFLKHSLGQKIIASWRSFWILEPFTPHTINILVGPVITTDYMMAGDWYDNWHLNGISANAYMLVGISLFGVAILFYTGLFSKRKWEDDRKGIVIIFFVFIASIWILYDFRMGVEFVRNVAIDHVQYISEDEETRTFRDRDRFYDFAKFVKSFVKDRETYEVFLPDPWPYFGSMRYYTYPSIPNPGDPVSDTWVVYEREDIVLREDNKLYHAGEAFTDAGEVIGQFSERSFVFREFTN